MRFTISIIVRGGGNVLQDDKEIFNFHSAPLTVMSQTTGRVRWTIQDVAALPDNEWIRYEIIDGELFAVRSPLDFLQKSGTLNS
ncbi:hypothetical protein [Fortiea contorta]|uniref:hypothetical protein n=1 Tax=Fortiea contorta TaxID=1892405 RepID=UPI00036B2987|nr:hypothetical protein [Fortiea contorta]